MGTNVLVECVKDFSEISLEKMNSEASYLDRIDKKYILSDKKLMSILDDFKDNFLILEINGKNIQNYSSIYMDTCDYFFYNQHQNKEEKRCKVRTRKYIDSDIAFFEYKQKENGITKKFRYQFDVSEHGQISQKSEEFFNGIYENIYSQTLNGLSPSIETKYNRITLCSKDLKERFTIDFNITFKDLRSDREIFSLDGVSIVESKSINKSNISSEIMKKYNIKKSKTCSKYAFGLIYNGIMKNNSTFEKTLNRIEKIIKQA